MACECHPYTGGIQTEKCNEKAAKIDKGSPESNKTKVASVSDSQIKEIAETKMKDLNANDIEHAKSMIAGTARSMGITVK